MKNPWETHGPARNRIAGADTSQGSTVSHSLAPYRACWGLLFVLVAAGVFWLPYHVPVLNPFASESAKVGFNNRVALASVLIGLAVATILSLFAPLVRQRDFGQAAAGQIGIRPLILVCGIETLLIGLLQWVAQGGPPFLETGYFLPRLYFMSQGLTPYRGFQFAYGPAMIYAPYWLQRMLGLSPQSAYTWCLLASSLAGHCILWGLLRQARAGYRAKMVAFVFFANFNIAMGLQYTLLRYLCGFGALSIVFAATVRLRRHWYLLSPLYAALTLTVLMISPEIGCALIVGLLAYLILEFGISREFFWSASAYLLLVAVLIRLLLQDAFQVLLGFAGGGEGLPVLPSPYVLLYLGTLFAIVTPMLADALALLRGQKLSTSRPFGGPLTIAFAVQSICLIPGALGRADMGHVYFYGLGVFLLAILGSWPTGRWQVAYWSALVGIFPVLGLAIGLYFALPFYMSTAGQKALRWVEDHPTSSLVSRGESAVGEARWSAVLARLRRVRDLNLERNYPELANLGPICEPFDENAVYSVLARHGILKAEYYYTLANVVTRERVQRKIADLRTCTYLILRSDSIPDEGQPAPSPTIRDADSTRALQLILCFPWLPPRRESNAPEPFDDIAAVIRSEFVATRQLNENWVLWRKSAPNER